MSAAANIIYLDEQLETAWDEYRAEAVKLMHRPELLTDRPFMERLTRAERKWKRLFNMQDCAL